MPVLLLATVLFMAGCADDGAEVDADAGPTSTQAGTVPPDAEVEGEPTPEEGEDGTVSVPDDVPTGPAPGVSDDAIKVGVTYVDLVAVRDFVDLDHGDYEGAYRAVIDDINANGGIHGRRIEPVFAGISPLGTADADAACVQFAQDEEVFAVIGFHYADTPLCYLEVEGTAVIGGTMNSDRLARATAPWFSTEPSSDLDLDALDTFAEQGLLDEPFAVYGTITEPTLFDETMARLSDLGAEPVASAVLEADANDLNAQVAGVQVIVENFRSAGAESVLVVGSGPVSWANGVEQTTYRPRLLMTNAENANAIPGDAGTRDLTILDDAVVAGLYGPQEAQYAEPAMRACTGVIEDAGIAVPDPADRAEGDPELFVSAAWACRNMTLFAAIAEAAGERLDYGSFRYAGEHLGETAIPGFPEPFTYGPPPSADGDPRVYLYQWDPSGSEFVRFD